VRLRLDDLLGLVGRAGDQAEGVVIVIIYNAVISMIILKVIDIAIGLSVTEEIEREGLDLTLHGGGRPLT